MKKQLIAYLERKYITLLALLSFFLFAGHGVWYFLNDQLALYGDARSRLLLTRGVFDSLTPGFVQLGAVWPPVPQIFFLTTIWNDYLFYSGLSGTLISILLATALSYFFAKLVFSLTKSYAATFLGLAFLVLNPSLLYMATTPMSEVSFLTFTVMTTYFFSEWVRKREVVYIPLAALSVVFACLSRYEGYFIPLFSVVSIILLGIIRRTKFSTMRGHILLYSLPAFASIVFWLLYNLLIFGDAIHFVHGETSHLSRAAGEASGSLTKGNIINTLKAYIGGGMLNVGIIPFFLITPALVFATMRQKSQFVLPLFLLTAPLMFDLFALFFGATDIFSFSNQGYLYNIRIGLFFLPFIALCYGLLGSIRHIRIILPTILFVQVAILFATPPITLQEAINSAASERGIAQKEVVGFLNKNPRTGKMLISYTTNQTVVFDARISPKTVVSEGSGSYWTRALLFPNNVTERIIISPLEGDVLWEQSKKNTHYLDAYKLVYQNDYFHVYDLQQKIVSVND